VYNEPAMRTGIHLFPRALHRRITLRYPTALLGRFRRKHMRKLSTATARATIVLIAGSLASKVEAVRRPTTEA